MGSELLGKWHNASLEHQDLVTGSDRVLCAGTEECPVHARQLQPQGSEVPGDWGRSTIEGD